MMRSFVSKICMSAAFAAVLGASPAHAVCGDLVVDGLEECDGGSCCTAGCLFADSDTVCRVANAEQSYDVADYCDGQSAICPNEVRGEGKNGGFFRASFPTDWDGDIVIINHGFDLNPLHIRPHGTCGDASASPCRENSECTAGDDIEQFCNNISYSGIDRVLLPQGKAVMAGTYSQTGWAVFGSSKDIKDMMTFVKKNALEITGKKVNRVLVTGFSLGGAVTADAILKLKINGAVPLCGAVGGGLPTWDVAQDVRLVYDFICDDAPAVQPFLTTSPKFNEPPDLGVATTIDSDADAFAMGLKVNACFGIIAPSSVPEEAAGQAQRLADFLELTQFSGYQGDDAGLNVASAMGFATLGLGDFVRDSNRLDSKRIGFNTDPELDYSALGDNSVLSTEFDNEVKRLVKGKGRATLNKFSNPNFLKGKGKKVAYPIVMMAGAADWLVIPEFERVFTTALTDGSKAHTMTWIDTFGHCVFTEQEVTATFNKFFEWLGPFEGPPGTQPTKLDIHNACLALPGGEASTCNFNDTFAPDALLDRIPQREDWPEAAGHL